MSFVSANTLIDLEFVRAREGGQELMAYVPEFQSSGPTIASGLDLGQHNEDDLNRIGIDTRLIEKFRPYLGRKGEAANLFVIENPLELSKQDADKVDELVFDHFGKWLVKNYDESLYRRNTPPTVKRFVNLPHQVQTVMFDLVYNMGMNSKKYPNAWHFFQKNWWDKLHNELMDFGHKSKGLNNRRQAEAALIRPLLPDQANASPDQWRDPRGLPQCRKD